MTGKINEINDIWKTIDEINDIIIAEIKNAMYPDKLLFPINLLLLIVIPQIDAQVSEIINTNIAVIAISFEDMKIVKRHPKVK